MVTLCTKTLLFEESAINFNQGLWSLNTIDNLWDLIWGKGIIKHLLYWAWCSGGVDGEAVGLCGGVGL